MRVFVPCQGERRRAIVIDCVTAFAVVSVRRAGELAAVLILVTVGAVCKLQLEHRIFAFGNVALRTLQLCVAALQRVLGLPVLRETEGRRLETVHGVAIRALNSPGSLRELALVRIGRVAIRAFGEGQRLLEISSDVALRTVDGNVLAEQGELGFRVIEILAQDAGRNLLPSRRAVA